MGKFTGFLKCIKKVAGLGSAILNGLNNDYKAVKHVADTLINLLQGGNYITTGLNCASKAIDTINPIAQKYLVNEDNKEKLENLSNNIKRHVGNVAQKVLNTYTDMQDELYKNKGNFTLKDYGNKMLFGKPLNNKLHYRVNDDTKYKLIIFNFNIKIFDYFFIFIFKLLF